MENDGITRVQGGEPERPTAWPVYPNKISYEDRLQGTEANEVISRQDACCVNAETFEDRDGRMLQLTKDWSVYIDNQPPYNIDRMDVLDEEEYSALAQILERQLGKVGLTIIVT